MDWLTELHRRIQEQKLKQEKTIQCLKQLYKAWPISKDSEESKKGKQSGFDTDSTAKSGNVKEENEPHLTAEEREGLEMMEKILSKAQKARDIQKKLEEPKKPRVKPAEPAKSCGNSSVTTQPSGVVNVRNDSRRLVTDRADVSNKQASTAEKVSSKVKPLHRTAATSSAKTTEKTERSRISHRPQSSSGNKKVVPVHASAPFQTNPNLKSSKLQTTYRAATAKTLAKSRGATNSAKSRVYNGKSANVEIKPAASGDSNIVEQIKEQKPVDNDRVSEWLKSTEVVVEDDVDSNNTRTDDGTVEERLRVMTVSDNIEQRAELRDDEEKDKIPEPKHFDLMRDGGSLSVPGRLKKLMHQNKKLRQKLYTQNVTQKVSSPKTSPTFQDHLQHMFGDETSQMTQLQAKQAEYIVHTYNSLLHILDNLHLDQISADSDPTDIYYCKKMVEHILVTFQDTEQLLHTTEFDKLKCAKLYSGSPVPKLPVTEPSSMAVWYDKNTHSGTHSPPTVYQYSNYKHLETYMTLMFKVQLIQLQIDVMDTVARLLLPVLHTTDPDSSEFAQVLRSAYSLLSVNRNHMPVVVKDTMQEDSVLQEDDG